METGKKFESIMGGGEHSDEAKLEELRAAHEKYSCGIDAKPRWCIWGVDRKGGRGVLYWIRPSEDDELVARRIAKIISQLGGSAKAAKTEWNGTLEREPIYKRNKALDL